MSLTRRVFGATGLITVASGVSRFAAVLAAPILTALLGPAPYAVSTLVATLTSLMVNVSLLGIDMSYARYYFGSETAGIEQVERLCWRFALGSTALMAGLGAALWVLGLASAMHLSVSLAIVVALGVFLTPLNTMAQTRARLQGRYRRIAVSILATGVVGALCSIALAWWWRPDAWALLLGGVVGVTVGAAVVGIPSPRALLAPLSLTRQQAWDVIKLGLPGVATATMYWVLSSSDRWIIALYYSKEALGIYSFAASLGLLGLMLNGSITLVWFPEATRSYEEDRAGAPEQLGRLWVRLVTLLGLVWLAVASAGGDVLRLLADPRFHSGAAYIPWVAGGVFFYGVASLANTGLFLGNDMRPAAYWWLFGAALCVGTNFLVIPRFGAMGAAVVVCLSYGLITSGVMFSSESRFPLRIAWGTLLTALGTIVLAGVLMAPAWFHSSLASLLVKFPVGVLVSVVALRIVAPDWLGAAFARLPLSRALRTAE